MMEQDIIKTEKINDLEKALEYCVTHKHGTLKELKEALTEEMIEHLSLVGFINI